MFRHSGISRYLLRPHRCVFLYQLLWLVHTLPLPVSTAANDVPLPDLSKLTRLKEVVWTSESSVQWITTTPQTAQSINLEKITIHSPSKPIVESAYREWQDLDRLVLQFWISRSIRLKIGFRGGEGRYDLRQLTPRLLLELASRRVVDPDRVSYKLCEILSCMK